MKRLSLEFPCWATLFVAINGFQSLHVEKGSLGNIHERPMHNWSESVAGYWRTLFRRKGSIQASGHEATAARWCASVCCAIA